MKKITSLLIAFVAALGAQAQVTADTVSIGAGYANQVWYSLHNGVQGTAPQSDWDIAFDADPMGHAIVINANTLAWKHPGADTSDWATLDTLGLSTWSNQWNGPYWSEGAIGNYPDPLNPFNVDWGVYNPSNHSVTGTALYVVKLANGDYKKLWIQSLIGTTFKFKYANLDGTGLQTATVNKTSFSNRNLCYYSMQNNLAPNREPSTYDWDLVFTTYSTQYPTPHVEAGVLGNINTGVAKCTGISNVSTYKNYQSAMFLDSNNVIGHDWKTGSGSSFTVENSTLYFVNVGGDIYKIVFTAFGGDVNGDYIFTNEVVKSVTGIANTPAANAVMALYPNPAAAGQQCTVVYDLKNTTTKATIMVNDITGKLIYSDNLPFTPGLQQYHLPVAQFTPGTYVVTVLAGRQPALQQQLVLQ
ncbi:T9SS type A sorting domain-containing protein [Polluticoccus soli]|uniref:T9SS type A sorting domain-containing protein n=1 Tax=Polluticoccus soli TaxID=3034150 RepID=UPI0023E1DA33|nr:T9SS type A sorting domain-containing protein [Flavipsychrobacter sp. JY13-12]